MTRAIRGVSMWASVALSTAALIALGCVAFVPRLILRSPAAATTTPRFELRDSFAVADTIADDLLARAQDRDPFFAVQTTAVQSSAPATPSTALEPPLRVLGTVVDSTGGSFALCQLGATPPVVLRVGQRIGDYELRGVEKAAAVFFRPDSGRVERRVARAGA